MRKILLTIFVFGQILIGYTQTNKEKVSADFFYGTWNDSTKTGMTLTQEKEFLLVPNKAPEPGHEALDLTKVRWSYNLVLDKTPIVIEITCTKCDESRFPKSYLAKLK